MAGALGPQGTGLVWTAVQEGRADRQVEAVRRRAACGRRSIQVTNLGITVKDSPQNTLVFVTRLDTGAPVAGAKVSIVQPRQQRVLDAARPARTASRSRRDTPLRDADDWWKFAFVVTAEKDGDVAYVGSDWNEGIQPWDFGTAVQPERSGAAAARHGVQRSRRLPARRRGALQGDPPAQRAGRHPAAAGRHAGLRQRPRQPGPRRRRADGQGQRVEQRRVDADAAGGRRARQLLRARDARERQAEAAARRSSCGRARRPGPRPTTTCRTTRSVHGSFLVAAYRRPDFRVDVALTGDQPIAGDPLKGVVTARYLFGAPMGARPVTWTFTQIAAVRRAGGGHATSFPTIAGCSSAGRTTTSGRETGDRSGGEEAKLAATGELRADARHQGATPACRTSTRSKATSRTSRASTSPTAPASPCIRRRGTSASGGRRTSSSRRPA